MIYQIITSPEGEIPFEPPIKQPENPCPSCITPDDNKIVVRNKTFTKTDEVIEDSGEIFSEMVGEKIGIDNVSVFLVNDKVYTLKAMDLHHSVFRYYKWIKELPPNEKYLKDITYCENDSDCDSNCCSGNQYPRNVYYEGKCDEECKKICPSGWCPLSLPMEVVCENNHCANKVREEAKNRRCCPTAQNYIDQNESPSKITKLMNWCNCSALDFSKYDCTKLKIDWDTGPCEAYFEGIYFDKEKNKCVEGHSSGCSSPFIFSSIEECELFCLK